MRLLLAALAAIALLAAPRAAPASPSFGPFNIDVPEAADGIERALPPMADGWHVGGHAPFSLHGWIELRSAPATPVIIAGFGTPEGGALLAATGDALMFLGGVALRGAASLSQGWHFVAATSDGTHLRLFADGRQVAEGAPGPAITPAAFRLAPRLSGFAPFAGRLMDFTVEDSALSDQQVRALAAERPDPSLTVFTNASPTWPVQLTNAPGLLAPQDPWTLPKAKTPPSKPVAVPAYGGPSLVTAGPRDWTLPKWRLAAAPTVTADGAALSRPGFDDSGWYAATVPGTVLTTLVDRGVYPDPTYGLNNMAIPESLARQDYWYRTEFAAPDDLPARRTLIFDGINYTAEVWLNGERLGEVRGAFIRGRFDVTHRLLRGANAIAVRIHPPLHPGIVDEESLARGAGFNGGMQALDGPTFFATEGWDWIPGVRDRNVGLWQGVRLTGTGDLALGDPQVVTTLPRPDEALVAFDVPVSNVTSATIDAELSIAFADAHVRVSATLPPGETVLHASVTVPHPKLWWPNGYGDPALHTAHVTVAANGRESDATDARFGIRTITYELSLMDPDGRLRRVELDYARARQLGQRITDGRHESIRKVAGGWVNSLTEAGTHSDAVRDDPDTRLSPYLVIKVNGVRIAARGGSWGMDDMLKRIGRERLEPFFRLHRDAHVNIIRNWVGQNTEPVFYDLADEYGLLVVNDFWDSTQNYQEEPDDASLFLANAADVIARYRNHPSIALWFGRNEGVPPPAINAGLQDLAYALDGTRWYNGSSNQVSLWFSGPYDYREPDTYFTTHTKGFGVEVGSVSFPTLEAFESAVPEADRWPVSDTWAYHDWHQDGNGDVHGFVAAMDAKLGKAADLPDFERKAQLLNYETYRAIMEGMNAELWSRTSGRMLWMTQPAWISTMWQIMSHDYDTHAAYYGFKSAAEPVHAQMTLPDHRLQLVNNTRARLADVSLNWRVLALDGRGIAEGHATVAAEAGLVADGPTLDLAGPLAAEGAVLIRIEATSRDGETMSRNTYWIARDAGAERKLSAMPPQPVRVALARAPSDAGADAHVVVTLRDEGTAPALNTKLTLLGPDGARILPTYCDDNYISLLPGEERRVAIAYPAAAPPPHVAVRGWNVVPATATAE